MLNEVPKKFRFTGTTRIGTARYYRFEYGREVLEIPLRCYR